MTHMTELNFKLQLLQMNTDTQIYNMMEEDCKLCIRPCGRIIEILQWLWFINTVGLTVKLPAAVMRLTLHVYFIPRRLLQLLSSYFSLISLIQRFKNKMRSVKKRRKKKKKRERRVCNRNLQ